MPHQPGHHLHTVADLDAPKSNSRSFSQFGLTVQQNVRPMNLGGVEAQVAQDSFSVESPFTSPLTPMMMLMLAGLVALVGAGGFYLYQRARS